MVYWWMILFKTMDYKQGQRLEFDIYGTTVKGDFVKIVDDKIIIKVTKDFIKDNIGKEQSIHKSHKHILID